MADHPLFDRMIDVQSNLDDRTISITLATSDGRGFVFNLSLPIVGALMGAVSAEAYRLNGQLPDEEKSDAATLTAQAVILDRYDDGRPMIVLELQNGSLLPLIVSDGDLAGLSEQLSRLTAGDPRRHN